jgi:hypothetical protein
MVKSKKEAIKQAFLIFACDKKYRDKRGGRVKISVPLQ